MKNVCCKKLICLLLSVIITISFISPFSVAVAGKEGIQNELLQLVIAGIITPEEACEKLGITSLQSIMPRSSGNLLEDGTYYLNNLYYGRYLHYATDISTTPAVNGVSGLLDTLGTTIQWEIQYVPYGYVLRAKDDSTRYLGVTESTTNPSLTVVTITNSTIPERCIWRIRMSDLGGCLVQNTYSSQYLCCYGTSISVSSSLGAVGSTQYETRVWRILSTDYLGTTANHRYKELQSDFYVSDVFAGVNETHALQFYIPDENVTGIAGTVWAAPSDFTYTFTTGTPSCVTLNTSTYSVTASKIGAVKYTVTHKVTGWSTTFSVFTDQYTKELTSLFGFDYKTAGLIRDLYRRIDEAYPNETQTKRAWRVARILSEFCYDGVTTFFNIPIINKWDDVAGSVTTETNIESYFVDTLGYASSEFTRIRTAIINNHSNTQNTGLGDFSHMQYSLAARLAYKLDLDGFASNIGTLHTDLTISYLAGWLGDATITEINNGTTVFDNDDYIADLDAENIFTKIENGMNSIQAVNSYYNELTPNRTRATIFLEHITYDTVQGNIFYELIDANFYNIINAASLAGDIVTVVYYQNLINDEEYHWDILLSDYPDTYNFLLSLQDKLCNIASYD